MFFIFGQQHFTFSPDKLSIFNQFLFSKNSFAILISMARNPQKFIFEQVLTSTKLFFSYPWLEKRNFLGVEEFYLFIFKLCCSRSYYYVPITTKISFCQISNDFCNFPRGGPKTRKCPTAEFWQVYCLSVFIGFQRIFGFGLLLPISAKYLILGATKSKMADEPLGGGGCRQTRG